MQVLSRSVPRRLLRRHANNVATSPSSMHRLAPLSHPILRCWPSSLAPPTHLVSRFPHGSRNMSSSTGVKSEEDLDEPDKRPLKHSAMDLNTNSPLRKRSAISQDMNQVENTDTTNKQHITRHSHFPPAANSAEDDKTGSMNAISGDEDACSRTALEVIADSKPDDTAGEIVDMAGCELSRNDKEFCAAGMAKYLMDEVEPMELFERSSHRDGSIYRDTHDGWKNEFRIANRNETGFEATRLSHPTNNCIIHDGICIQHGSRHMLQIFSLRLAKIPLGHDPVELYGYMAARDSLDSLLNYFINVSRDDPIIVEKGSLIEMAGPKRGILFIDSTTLEFDMKIKTGKHENEDLQLIDGATNIDYGDTCNCRPFTLRIHGDCGAIDITASCIRHAVEATVEVAISQVQSSFGLNFCCLTSGIRLKKIRLFAGAITEPRDLKRFVIAVVDDGELDLVFKVATAGSQFPAEYWCSFVANRHGHETRELRTAFALIAMKVTWSTVM